MDLETQQEQLEEANKLNNILVSIEKQNYLLEELSKNSQKPKPTNTITLEKPNLEIKKNDVDSKQSEKSNDKEVNLEIKEESKPVEEIKDESNDEAEEDIDNLENSTKENINVKEPNQEIEKKDTTKNDQKPPDWFNVVKEQIKDLINNNSTNINEEPKETIKEINLMETPYSSIRLNNGYSYINYNDTPKQTIHEMNIESKYIGGITNSREQNVSIDPNLQLRNTIKETTITNVNGFISNLHNKPISINFSDVPRTTNQETLINTSNIGGIQLHNDLGYQTDKTEFKTTQKEIDINKNYYGSITNTTNDRGGYSVFDRELRDTERQIDNCNINAGNPIGGAKLVVEQTYISPQVTYLNDCRNEIMKNLENHYPTNVGVEIGPKKEDIHPTNYKSIESSLIKPREVYSDCTNQIQGNIMPIESRSYYNKNMRSNLDRIDSDVDSRSNLMKNYDSIVAY